MKPEDETHPQAPNPDGTSKSAASPRSSRSQGTRRLRWVLLVLAVCGVTGLLAARPVWRTIKAQRARGFAQEAAELIRQEKWDLAFEKTRSALQLAPTHPEILRLAAHLHARAGLEMGFPYFEALLSTDSATREDKEELVALALGTGHNDLAASHLKALLEEPAPSARTFLLAAQLQGGLRRTSNAVHYARQAVRVDPGNPTNLLTLGRILLASRSAPLQTEARDLIRPLARSPGPLQAAAIGVMLSNPETQRSDREEVLALLEAKPRRTLVEELLLQDVAVSLDPSRRTEIADRLVQDHGRSSPENTLAVGAWLNRQQLHARTLDLVPPELAVQSPSLIQLRFEALTGTGDARGAYDFVVQISPPGHPLQIEFLRCQAATRLKDQEAIDRHFKNLLVIAAREPRQLRTVADFALRNGRKDIALQAAQQLARNPRDAAAAYTTLLRIADSEGETWPARDHAKKLATLRGKTVDDALKLQIAYYDLLLEENLEAAFATATAMHQANPDDFTRRVVLGLGHLRRGQPQAAVELIDHQLVAWNQLPAGIRAITVAILGANRRDSATAKLVGRVPLARLKPEERELIRPYVVGTPAASADEPDDLDETPEKL